VVEHGGIHQPGARQHPRRRDRNQLDEQAGAGEGGQRGAPADIVGPVPDEQPDQAGNQDREVQGVVVQIESLHDQRMRQERLLQAGLARQVQHALEMPDPAPARQRAVRPHDRKGPGELPEREQPEHQRGLLGEHRDGGQPRPSRPAQPGRDDDQAAGRDRSLRPGQIKIRHVLAALRPAPGERRPGSKAGCAVRPPATPRSCGSA